MTTASCPRRPATPIVAPTTATAAASASTTPSILKPFRIAATVRSGAAAMKNGTDPARPTAPRVATSCPVVGISAWTPLPDGPSHRATSASVSALSSSATTCATSVDPTSRRNRVVTGAFSIIAAMVRANHRPVDLQRMIDDLVIPELSARGLEVGRDVLVLHCPERLRPGRLLRNLRSIGRLVGGDSEQAVGIGIGLYRTIVHASLQGVHYRTAEVCKTAENTVRDVQIALANQIAVVCDAADVDLRQVRAPGNTLW